jgi:hypothetical protein
MLRFWHKAAVAAIGAVGISGLAMTGSASAVAPSVSLKVCNTAFNEQIFLITGTNDSGVTGTTRMFKVRQGCTQITDLWWAMGSTVTIKHQIGHSAVVSSPFLIPDSLPDRSEYTVTIEAAGPLSATPVSSTLSRRQ